MKFGHRGCNHPVKDLLTGKVTITSQNHGYAVDPSSIEGTGAEVTQLNLNDGTVEGIRVREAGLRASNTTRRPRPDPGTPAPTSPTSWSRWAFPFPCDENVGYVRGLLTVGAVILMLSIAVPIFRYVGIGLLFGAVFLLAMSALKR